MTTRVSIISLAIGLAILTAILWGWWYGATGGNDARSRSLQKPHAQAGNPGEHKMPRGEKPLRPSQNLPGKTDESLARRAFSARLAKMPLTELLAEFELTGDERFFAAAKAKYGSEPLFHIVAALLSKRPDSEALTQLEASQPDNALPNLLRAGMYAEQKNWKALAEQLQLAAGKSTLTLGSRERMAARLDIFIADQSRATAKAMRSDADVNLFLRLESIAGAFWSNPSLFGSPSETTAAGISLAMRLREMEEYDFMSRTTANSLEGQVLAPFDRRLSYGDSGMTIDQRYDQLNAAGRDTQKYASIYRAVLDPKTDSKTRTQFFARARADGEVAALQWYAEQRSGSK